MKATKIYYKRLFNLGNFQNAEIGIELEVEENEKAENVIKKAIEFVEIFNPKNDREQKIRELQRIIDNAREFKYGIVQDAKIELERLLDEEENDLPF